MIYRRQLPQRDVWLARALENEQSDVMVCSLAVNSFRPLACKAVSQSDLKVVPSLRDATALDSR